MAWGWRGRGAGWTGPWPGRGPFSHLPPWQRPGWLYGLGRGYSGWPGAYPPWVCARFPWLPRWWWAYPQYGYGLPYAGYGWSYWHPWSTYPYPYAAYPSWPLPPPYMGYW
jgi:hypothetical protein